MKIDFWEMVGLLGILLFVVIFIVAIFTHPWMVISSVGGSVIGAFIVINARENNGTDEADPEA